MIASAMGQTLSDLARGIACDEGGQYASFTGIGASTVHHQKIVNQGNIAGLPLHVVGQFIAQFDCNRHMLARNF